MVDTSQDDETIKPEALKNEVTPVAATPVANAVDPAEVERLRKEQAQKDLRIRQLENEAEARKKADEEATTKDLEEKEQYKTLLEQERAKREQIESEREAELKARELASMKAELLKDYPDEVRGLAEDAGIELADTDDDSVTAFKERLDKVSKRVNVASVGPNNPSAPTPGNSNLSPQEIHDMLKDPKKTEEFYRKNAKDFPVTASMLRERP